MAFLLNWLLWQRKIKKQEAKNAKIFEKLGNNEVIAEMAERDPQLRENLHTLGVEIKPK